MRYQLLVLVLGVVLLSGVVMSQPPPPEVPTVEFAPTPKAVDRASLTGPQNEPMASWPGPDGFNYRGSTCPYNWLDITATGNPVTLSNDSNAGPFDIGFPFPLL